MIIGLLLLGIVIFVLVGVLKVTGPLVATVFKAALLVLVIIAVAGFFVPPLHDKNVASVSQESGKETVSVNLN